MSVQPQPQPAAKTCPSCGRVANVHARFCETCGHQYRTEFAPASPAMNRTVVITPAKTAAKNPYWLIPLVIGLAVAKFLFLPGAGDKELPPPGPETAALAARLDRCATAEDVLAVAGQPGKVVKLPENYGPGVYWEYPTRDGEVTVLINRNNNYVARVVAGGKEEK